MKLSITDIKTAVTAENLFVQSFKAESYKFLDTYILSNKIDRINISDASLADEIKYLENTYKPKGVCCFLIDPSTSPNTLKQFLTSFGYKKDETYDDVWWFKKTEDTESEVAQQIVNIVEVKSLDELKSSLNDTELEWWTSVFGNCLKKSNKPLLTKLYIGKYDNKVVSTYASAFYENVTIYKGAEVIENYRKRGINTQMMQHWLNEAKEYKCNWAVFQTDSSNFGSINTGKKFSFNMEFAKECYCKKLF